MKPQHLALMMLINMVWGFSFIPGKWAVDELSPILFTGLRYALLAVALLPFLKVKPGQMRLIFGIAMFTGALHFTFFYTGLSLADDVSSVAIAGQMGVPFATIVAMIFLKERIGWKRASGIGLSFGGIVIMSFDPRVFSYIDAMIVTMMAALLYSFALIFMKRLRDTNPFELQGWVAMFSWPVLFLVSALTESGQVASIQAASSSAWLGVVYTALGASLIGHAGNYYLVQRYDVSLTAPMGLLAPIFGVCFGIWLNDDIVTGRMLLGSAFVLGGCLIIALRKRQMEVASP